MVHVLIAPLNDDDNEIIESELIRLHQKGLISLEILKRHYIMMIGKTLYPGRGGAKNVR